MTNLLDQNLTSFLFPLFFVAIFLLCMGIFQIVRRQKQTRKMVQKIQQGGFADNTRGLKQDSGIGEPPAKQGNTQFVSFFSFFSKRSGKAKSQDLANPEDIKIKFLQAGINSRNFEAAFFGAKLFLPLVCLCIFLAIRLTLFPLMETPRTILFTVIAALFGFYLPDIWLKQKTDKRKITIFKALPDAIDLMVVCVEAGMGLDAAMLKVSKEIEDTYPDLAREFAYLNLEIRAGKPRNEALRNLYRRTNVDEMNSLVTMLIQTNKFGTSASQGLQVFSQSFRTKRYQMAEEIAAKLPVKILLPLLIFIFPALFVVILGPAAISIYKNFIMR